MAEISGTQRVAETARPLTGRFKPMRVALYVYMAGEAGLAIAGLIEYYVLTSQGLDPYLDMGTVSTVFSISGSGDRSPWLWMIRTTTRSGTRPGSRR